MDDEPQSLEYEEDCYYAYISGSGTPSFDHNWPDDVDSSTFCIVDEHDESSLETESCSVETEFQKKPHNVKVTFQDISKPYLARVSSPKNYRRFLQLVKAEEAPTDVSPDSGINELQGLSPEEQERQKQEWQQELVKVEEEIQTLRHVLASKIKHSQELKRKLGISVWKEFQDDMSQSIRNVKESNIYQNVEDKLGKFSRAVTEAPLYQKTESVIKTTAEKTTTLLGGLGSSVTTKIGQLKNSDSFRSLEEKVGSAYENVKTKVVTSRSNSTQSFDEALREAEANRRPSNGASTPATTPTIPEEKPLS
ncbi:tumor protein D54 isoform X1 [Schistocerca americana]|uniref:tumor protein D54 isoform X1 n=1 Tax=Schistocerca americana TaxID=7009 RepID=UPI001F500682|nr:tumor protein D54 isoform X1 [Schistocerca americana]XP_049802820.1 tumor protein D54 isoform X1 [Schistocerca nitens]XP_049949241.1 tumor protein D54 isoform X1 [Schistocerca serialis cubense]